MASLVQTRSIASTGNASEIWDATRIIDWPCALLSFLLFLLTGAEIATHFLVPVLGEKTMS